MILMSNPKQVRQGRHAIIEQFLADGLTVMFGNPGTVEQGFLNALESYPDMRYVLTSQETIAVFAGDGFARSTKKPALVQIHSSPGLGNALGAIYQANRGHSPLIVIGGDAGIKYQPMQAQMYADLVAMAAPVTKLSTMVQDPSSLLRVLRRAIKVAFTPPMGPVYVCLPADILDMPNDEIVRPTFFPQTDSIANGETLTSIAKILSSAERPRLFIGDGIHYSKGAGKHIENLAELIGADIYGVDAGEANVDIGHPLYRGQTGHMFGEHSKPITMEPDVVFICGTYMVPEVFPDLVDIYDPTATVIHIDLDAGAIAKNHRVDYGMVADPAKSLEALCLEVKAVRSETQAALHSQRKDKLISLTNAERVAEAETFSKESSGEFATMAGLARELFSQAKDVILVEEALTNSPALVEAFRSAGGQELHQTRGGSLGMGLASAIGVQIANPNRMVVSVSGDGGGMYTIQSLWSAARHKLPIKYIVCNNGVYNLLKLNILQYWKSLDMEPGDIPLSFDLSSPMLRFDDLARAMSVPSIAVTKSEEIPAAVAKALAEPGPFLIDLRIQHEVHEKLIGVKCGQ